MVGGKPYGRIDLQPHKIFEARPDWYYDAYLSRPLLLNIFILGYCDMWIAINGFNSAADSFHITHQT